MPNKRIYLCLAHMSETNMEQKYIQEAFDTNWVVPLGPNVNGFEADLEHFVNEVKVVEPEVAELGRSIETPTSSLTGASTGSATLLNKRVVALSSGTAAVHLALIACGVKPGDEVVVQSFTFCASSHPITYLGIPGIVSPVIDHSEQYPLDT